MRKRCLATAALLLGPIPCVFADDAAEPIIVTATRTAQTADETLAPVTVITREEIERQQATSVQDALRGVPGLTVANNGGPGKATSVFLRGTESDHALVLIDGVKAGSATSGGTAFQDLPVEQIERIEIVRGPRSALYGSEAIGGVIQIFTRKGGGAVKPYASLGAGSYGTYNASAGVSGGGERGWFNVSASGTDTQGFNACDDMLGGMGCGTHEPDDDGYRNTSHSVRAGRRFDDGTQLEAFWLRAAGTTDYDAPDDFDPLTYQSFESGPNETEFVQETLGASIKLPLGSTWHLSLLAGQSRDQSDNFKSGGVFDSRFDTERDTVSLQNDFSIGTTQLLTAGLDYQADSVDSTVPYAVTSRDNHGLFAQYQTGFGRQDVQVSLRGDDNEQFGSFTTGGAAWGYGFGNGLRLTASYGTAFKAPTFNELYYPDFGNPNLEPEESQSVELGLSGTAGGGRWSLNAYETRVDELIAYDTATSAPGNIDEARIRGLEAVIAARLKAWDLRTSLTLLDPENRSSGANNGNVLPRRAEQALRVDLDRGIGSVRIGATLFTEGRRFDDYANTREMGGYATVDLRTEYAFTKAWRAQARVENLFDKDYETAASFNQPGRSYFVTLRYQP